MTMLEAALERFDASKERVRQEIREGFFDENGDFCITEKDLRLWIADRAVDELKVVLQLASIVAKAAHLIAPHILVQVTEQMSDEARHFDILRGLVPAEVRGTVDAKVADLPGALAADPHWGSLLTAVEDGNPFAALLDINIVHEGYSVAAIEELKGIPFDDIREAYAGIGADEAKHHESGRELLLWLANAAQVSDANERVVAGAHERAVEGGAMSWSWPAASATEIIETAHERAVDGGAMSWSWPSQTQNQA